MKTKSKVGWDQGGDRLCRNGVSSKDHFPLILPKFPRMWWPLLVTWVVLETKWGFHSSLLIPFPGKEQGHLAELPGSWNWTSYCWTLNCNVKIFLLTLKSICHLSFLKNTQGVQVERQDFILLLAAFRPGLLDGWFFHKGNPVFKFSISISIYNLVLVPGKMQLCVGYTHAWRV